MMLQVLINNLKKLQAMGNSHDKYLFDLKLCNVFSNKLDKTDKLAFSLVVDKPIYRDLNIYKLARAFKIVEGINV